MNILKMTTGVALVSLFAAAALAHGGATGIVKERMDGMSAMKDSMKILTPMMQGKTPYNAQTVRSEAKKIGRHAGESMTKLFPEGSDGLRGFAIRSLWKQLRHAGESMTKLFPEGSDGKPSEAKSEIWQDWGSFAELARQLESYSEGLVLAADNGLMMSGSGHGSGMMGGASMMGGGSMMGAGMMGGSPNQAQFSEMPADGVFMMLSQTCSACHTQFRSE